MLELTFDVGEQRARTEAEQLGLQPANTQLLLHEQHPVECLLRGLVGGRNQAITDHPSVQFLNDDDVENARRAQQGALAQMEAEHSHWRDPTG